MGISRFGRRGPRETAVESIGEAGYSFTGADLERTRHAVNNSDLDRRDRILITALLDIIRATITRKRATPSDVSSEIEKAFQSGARIETEIYIKATRIIPIWPWEPKSKHSLKRIIPTPTPTPRPKSPPDSDGS